MNITEHKSSKKSIKTLDGTIKSVNENRKIVLETYLPNKIDILLICKILKIL
jgi:hypothetical protein